MNQATERGALTPSQILNAGLSSNNAATLEYANGTPNLTNLHTASPSGAFTLNVDSSVPLNSYAAGLAVDGQPVTAAPADAHEQVVFTNPSSYAISVGPYEVGEALSPEVLTTYATLPFNNGATKVRVTLSQSPVDYSWSTEAVG